MSADKIVQLTEYRYNELYESAMATNKEVNRRAEKMYQEKGVCSIKINMDIKESYDSTIRIETGCYLSYKEEPFDLSHEQSKRVIRWIDKNLKKMMHQKVGINISKFNELNTGLRKEWVITRSITLTGWLVAIVLVVICLMK